MKKFLFAANLFLCLSVLAQTPNWQWVRSGKGAGHDYATSVSSDAAGNCYVTGFFQVPSAVFGTYSLTGSTNYHDNIFIARYDSLGNILWARTAIGEDNITGDCIQADATGNAYLVGRFQGSGTMTLGGITLTAPNGNGSAFLAKYDPSGNVLWAKTIGAPSLMSQARLSVDIDAAGNSYIAGNLSLGSGSMGADTIILMKYDNLGNAVWQQYANAQGNSWSVRSVASDAAGNSYVAGQFFTTSLKFGTTTISNNSNGQLIFVAKYNTAGVLQWVTPTGQYPSLYEPAIAVDANGNSFVTGYFNGNFAAFGTTTLTNTGWNDMFIVKLNNQGGIVWAKNGGGAAADQGNAVSVDNNGNALVTGFYSNSATFGTVSFFSSAYLDLFVMKYDANGNTLWGRSAGGNLNDRGSDICAKNGKIYVSGDFTSSKTLFGNQSVINCDTIQNPYEALVAKLGAASGNTLTTSVNAVTPKTGIRLQPHPMQQEAFIFSDEAFVNAELNLSDASGRNVLKISAIHGNNIRLERKELAGGVYLIRITEGTTLKYAGKLVVAD